MEIRWRCEECETLVWVEVGSSLQCPECGTYASLGVVDSPDEDS